MSLFKDLATRLSQWWSTNAKATRQQRAERAADLRREATARAQRAASKLSDLRDSEPAKRAGAAFNDLRASDVGKKAETTLSDLRQREPVKKAEESARKVMHDLFSGSAGSKDATGDN